MVEDSHIMGARISEKGNWGPENTFKSHVPSDLLPSATLYPLKRPESSEIVPPAGDQTLNTRTRGQIYI